MDLAQKPVYKLDLAAGTSVVNLTTPLVEGDDRAQTFALELIDKGAPANLNGYSVTAYFGRGKTAEAEADTIPLSGTVSGNVATITLTESCYSRSCYFSMPIRLSNGATGQKRTYLIVRGTVVKSLDGKIIDPDGSVPSLDDLFAQIAVMERSRQAAEEATEQALAAKDKANAAATNAVDIATEKGDQAIQLAQEEADKQNEKIAALTEDMINYGGNDLIFEQGTYSENPFAPSYHPCRCRTGIIPVQANKRMLISVPDGLAIWIYELDKNKNIVNTSGTYANGTGKFFYTPIGTCIAIVCRFHGMAEDVVIVPSDCDGISITTLENYEYVVSLQMERGGFVSDYHYSFQMADHKAYIRTAYRIMTNDADYIEIMPPISDALNGVYVRCYDSANNLLENIRYSWKLIALPATCSYIEIFGSCTEDVDRLTVRFYGADKMPCETKRIGWNAVSERLTFNISDDNTTTTRLMLPPNYSPEGNKVPLILWMDGSGNFTRWDSEISEAKVPYLQYLCDEGFAVLSVYSWGYNYLLKYNVGNAKDYPVVTNLRCYEKAIEYICSRYNIDGDNIHIMSKSQGGQLALYYASENVLGVKSVGMFSPVLDYLSMPGEDMYADTRKAIADELNLSDSDYFRNTGYLGYSDTAKEFWKKNLPELCGLNEAWKNLIGGTPEERLNSSIADAKTFWSERIWETDRNDIYTHTDYIKIASVPVKIWGARDDDNTPYLKMVEVVEQLMNGGTEAHIVTLPNGTGGHSCADFGTNVTDVVTALGIAHTGVPVGWVENVAWIRSKMAK